MSDPNEYLTNEKKLNSEIKVDDVNQDTIKFYTKAQEYWSKVQPTVNGMLGGLGYISAIDIQGSGTFLRNLKLTQNQRALDCGAGIGRVSKELLCPRFLKVDMVEQDGAFSEKAGELITEQYADRLGQIYNIGLQEFVPEADAYDLVWSQWVLGHLTDSDLLKFFHRIKNALHKKNAYFIIKENVTSSKEIEIDEVDSSLTRPLREYEYCLNAAGFKVVKVERQLNLPKGLYPVYMIASKPLDT